MDQSILALFFSQNFHIIFSQNICIFVILFFAKHIKAKFREKNENFCLFREKNENFCLFREQTKCKKIRKFSRMIFPIRCMQTLIRIDKQLYLNNIC